MSLLRKHACFPASSGRRIASAALVLGFVALPASSQDQTWIRQFGTNLDTSDGAHATIPDGAGGFFVAGDTEGSLGGPSGGLEDAWLARYDGAGNRNWIRELPSSLIEHAWGLAADGAGGVFLTGTSSLPLSAGGYEWNVWLLRYDGAGNLAWTVQLASSGNDQVEFALPDGAGGVFLGGDSDGDLGGPNAGSVDAWLARYDGLGNPLWIRQFGTASFDQAFTAAPDGAGGVFVGGLTGGALGGPSLGAGDAFLARYDGAGNRIWIRQFGTSDNEWVIAAASDGAGGAFLGGVTDGSLGGPAQGLDDVWLARYDGAGNASWITQFGTGFDDIPTALEADGAGGFFACGLRGSFTSDAWLARYDGAGNRLWMRTLQTPGIEILWGVASDGAGGVFACGTTSGSLGAPNTGSNDVVLVRYDGAGNRLWLLQFGSSDLEGATTAAPDDAGGVFVGGGTHGSLGGPSAGDLEAWFARYDGAGNQLWIRQLGTPLADLARASAADGAGGLFVGGDSTGSLGGPSAGGRDAWLARYESAGNPLWILQLGTSADESLLAAASDGAGGVVVAGTTSGDLGATNAGLTDVWVARYDGAGSRLWLVQFGTTADDAARAVAPDGVGGVFVGGETEGSLAAPNAGAADAWLARHDGAGNRPWLVQFGTDARDSLAAAAPRAGGGVFVAGETEGSLAGPNAGESDAWLARFDAAGNSTWQRQLGTSARDLLTSAVSDAVGGVYVGGGTLGGLWGPSSGNSDAWLARYDDVGNETWLRQLGTGGDERLDAAAPDGAGGVYTGGFTDANLGGAHIGGNDVWLARFAASCGLASATLRNAGSNPLSLQAGVPRLGSTFVATVDLTTTGHGLAMLRAFDGAVDLPWPGGQHILSADLYGHGMLYRSLRFGPLATFSIAIPSDAVLCGFPLSLQAIHLGGVVPFALSNAQDLILGG